MGLTQVCPSYYRFIVFRLEGMVKDYKQALKASEAEKEMLAAKLIKYEVFLLVHLHVLYIAVIIKANLNSLFKCCHKAL